MQRVHPRSAWSTGQCRLWLCEFSLASACATLGALHTTGVMVPKGSCPLKYSAASGEAPSGESEIGGFLAAAHVPPVALAYITRRFRAGCLLGQRPVGVAILDRLVHNTYRLALKGQSRRKIDSPLPMPAT